jgi:hypothetical protein
MVLQSSEEQSSEELARVFNWSSPSSFIGVTGQLVPLSAIAGT